MQLSILGAGHVGQALAAAFARQGQAVTIGTPEPPKYAAAVTALGPRVTLTTVDAALEAGEVVVLAVPWSAAEDIARSRADWRGRILVDATNPLAPDLSGLLVGTTDSGAERLARAAHGARVVKAFNTTGAENMADSRFAGGLPMMPLCGDDAGARQSVAALATLIGFEPVDFGGLRAARLLEPLAMAWIHLAYKRGIGRRFAFGMLRREA